MTTSVERVCVAHVRQRGCLKSATMLRLSWDVEDPYAVTAAFPEYSPVVWVFSVDLLEQGLTGLAGVGDVRCVSDGAHYTIVLSASRKSDLPAYIELRRSWVVGFLAAVEEVAPDDEAPWVDLDLQLAEWLDDAA